MKRPWRRAQHFAAVLAVGTAVLLVPRPSFAQG